MRRTLPVVLCPADVRHLLGAVPPGRNRLMLRIAYGCGLRVSELLHLRVTDVDGSRNVLWLRHGKGEEGSRRSPAGRATRRASGPLAGAPPARVAVRRAGRSTAARLHLAAGISEGPPGGWGSATGDDPHVAALLRHPSARGRGRSADNAATARPLPAVDHARYLHLRSDRLPRSGPRWNCSADRVPLRAWNDPASNWPTWSGRRPPRGRPGPD